MGAEVLDFAGLETAAAAATATPAVEKTEVTEIETPAAGEGKEEVAAGEVKEGSEDGKEKTEEGKDKEEALPGDKTTPETIRKALKALKDASPENAAAVKELHGSYERHQAYKKEFPTVQEAREAKEFIQLVGGQDGYEKLNATVQGIQESDALLYDGDPKLLDNIIEDLKSEGKMDSLGKLAPAFLDKLKQHDNAAFYKTFAPHFLDGIKEVQIPEVLQALTSALTPDDKGEFSKDGANKAAAIVKNMTAWLKGLETQAAKPKDPELTPERKAFLEEKSKFDNEKKEAETGKVKAFQTEVATACEKHNNQSLGKELGPFLKMPFFKGFPRETLVDLGTGIKENLYTTLKADKVYQAQMTAMWKAKSPDKAKITEYHNTKLDSIAARIVRETVQKRYPGYAKGGSAAGKVAAADEKKAATVKTDAAAVASGKPVYVATKPAWESLDHDRDPKDYLFAAGKGYLKATGKFVTWRK